MDQDLFRSTIGGSDVAVMMGLSPWRTPHDLWLEKMGRKTTEENDRMKMGKLCERFIIQLFEDEYGCKVDYPGPEGRDGIWRYHADAAWPAHDAVVEAKWKGAYMAREIEEGEAPLHDFLQCQYYAGMIGASTIYYVVMFGGPPARVIPIAAEPKIFDDIREKCGAWWERHIIQGIEPEMTGQDYIANTEETDPSKMGPLTPDDEQLAWELADARAGRVAKPRHEIDRMRDLLLHNMKGRVKAWGNGIEVTVTTQDRSRTNYLAALNELAGQYGLRGIGVGMGDLIRRHTTRKIVKVVSVKIQE